MFLLQTEGTFVETHRTHKWFATVPSEKHVVGGLRCNIIMDIFLQQLIAHLLSARRCIEFLFFEIIAISAVQIARRTSRFRHQMNRVHVYGKRVKIFAPRSKVSVSVFRSTRVEHRSHWASLQDEQSSKNSNVSLLTYEKAEQRHAKKEREVIKCRDYKLSFSMSLKYL